jgi:anti-sigma factor RsiW
MSPALRLRRDIVCQQAVELVTGYLEGTLARAGRRRFEAHLAGCPHCPEYLAQMRKTIELTGSLTPDDLTRRCRTSSSRSTGNGAPARTASQLAREPGGGARQAEPGSRPWSERGARRGPAITQDHPAGRGLHGWRP